MKKQVSNAIAFVRPVLGVVTCCLAIETTAFVTMALTINPATAQITRLTKGIESKSYVGYTPNPEGCDLSRVSGWFYWYKDTNEYCYVTMSYSQTYASKRAQEILRTSSVLISGVGFK
jgi:hypothetical protein